MNNKKLQPKKPAKPAYKPTKFTLDDAALLEISGPKTLVDKVLDILAEATFDKIPVVLSGNKDIFLKSTDTKLISIGSVDKFNSETNMFTVSVYNAYGDIIAGSENWGVVVKYFNNKETGELKITSLTLYPYSVD